MKRFIFTIGVLLALAASTAQAQISASLNVQGVLRDNTGKSVADGAYAMTFKFYDAATAGNLERTISKSSVTVKNGVFNLVLDAADLSTLTFSETYYIGVSVAGGSEFPTRVQLTSAPYALSLIGSGNSFPSSGNVTIGPTGSGRLGIGTTAPAIDLAIGDTDTGLDQQGDGVLTIKTNNTERMRINSSGIGIGTTSPTIDLAIGDSDTGLDMPVAGELSILANNVEKMRINGTGIGINKAPEAEFCVHATTGNVSQQFTTSDLTGDFEVGLYSGSGNAFIWNSVTGGDIRFSTNSTERMTITDAGRVGIGTTSPTAMLHVNGSVSRDNGAFTYYAFTACPSGVTTFTGCGSGSVPTSIFATGRVVGSEFNATSDARVKNIVGVSSGAADLAILNALAVTDFTYRDVADNGGAVKKGFIAQQVEDAFPEAVHQSREFIPNIYQVAEKTVYDAANQTLTISLKSAPDLKVGDKVRLMAEDTQEKEVMAVSGAGFTVKDWAADTKEVFVYGKEVDDFRVVDYDRIFSLNVSATQELTRQMTALQSEVNRLKSENAELKQLKAEIAQIKAALSGNNAPVIKQTNLSH